MTSGPLIWRLAAPPISQGDAVETALGLEIAKLRYGPFEFDFTKTSSPGDEMILTLRRDGAPHEAEPMSLLEHNEQAIPKAPGRLPTGKRKSLEARYLEIFGRRLFDDVAHLVRLEMEWR